MIYASVCSGIEAASVAWQPLGWRAAFFSEIEKFPNAVLAHRFPAVPNYGDMTKFAEWRDHAVDLIIGGTPCQSFSISGKRRGLADPRGRLMRSFIGVAEKYKPRWLIWENVPGVLSSGGGRDFAAFLSALAECGYFGAWRVLDAQYVRVDGFARAVPQRRRRVFFVGYIGDWRAGAEILFEREALERGSPPRRSPRDNTAGEGQAAFSRARQCADTLTANASNFLGRFGSEPVACCHAIQLSQTGSNGSGFSDKGAAYTLQAEAAPQAVVYREAVRRLMPVECERLMGFPDNYTALESARDTERYKALGNSMAVNCIRWLGRRIEQWEKIMPRAGGKGKRAAASYEGEQDASQC